MGAAVTMKPDVIRESALFDEAVQHLVLHASCRPSLTTDRALIFAMPRSNPS
jgi:hypothetical protein